jgi:hypothetical protein
MALEFMVDIMISKLKALMGLGFRVCGVLRI